MRIVGGQFRGRRLASLGAGDERARLRPTTDRLRESLFAILEGGRLGTPLPGAVVLDLFAGTGALGLEALSRGAAEATFVESGRKAAELIARNIRALGVEDRAHLVRADALRPGPVRGRAATLVFLDPPYGKGLGAKALAEAARQEWIAPGALIVWEEATAQEPPEGFEVIDRRDYGGTVFTFLRHRP